MTKDAFLNDKTRAEDIILGALGYGEEAKIIDICRVNSGFSGKGLFSDGETFEFFSEDELTPLEDWAIKILQGGLKK